jgi:hypothetical protein
MNIIIPKPNKKALKKNGWEYLKGLQFYRKIINECCVCIEDPDNDLPFGCWITYERATPDDLIAIGNELKKLEENN